LAGADIMRRGPPQGNPCHDWAKGLDGYFATLCGELGWLKDAPSLNFSSGNSEEGGIDDSKGSNVLSLVFCSDDWTQCLPDPRSYLPTTAHPTVASPPSLSLKD
jgi:hypothetical protein